MEVYVGIIRQERSDISFGVLLLCQLVGDINLPIREALVKGIDPEADAAFAGVDFLTAADQADDGRPVFVLVQRPDEELPF